jgi:hypothetical protein
VKVLSLVLLLASLFAAGTSKPPRPLPPARVTTVEVEVTEWSPAIVWATIVDRRGRRCGGSLNHPLREIPGCDHQFEWEEGAPKQPGSGADSTKSDAPGGSPDGLHFTIRDSAATRGVVEDGACELLLASEGAGLVRLSLVAEARGLSDGKDTTSVAVRKGKPTRLRLIWRVEGGKCVAKISRDLPVAPRKR